jgi:hypothetical protein
MAFGGGGPGYFAFHLCYLERLSAQPKADHGGLDELGR